MTRTKRIIRALDLFLAMYACVALLNYAHAKRFEQPWISSPHEVNQSAQNPHQSAVDTYELMVAYSPNDAALRRKLGDAYYNLAQYEKAGAAYGEALRLNPTDYETKMRLGNLSIAMNHLGEARAAFEAARRIAPKDVSVKKALSDLQERELYDRFLTEHLNNPRSAYVAATEYLAQSGNKDDEFVRYLRWWVEDFEKRVPPEKRPLQNPPRPSF